VDVASYTREQFVHLLATSSGADSEFVSRKSHVDFFNQYLQTLGVRTILIEERYIDKDYLQDFTGYYVTCFTPYKKETTRLHFFARDFDKNEIECLLSGTSTATTPVLLQEAYLGFIVVKPLSQTIIGRTCLRTYMADGGRRVFPVLRQYRVNLYGLSLHIESVPFQEQDSVAAACATSALWSCLHSTGKYFHHPILSPTEITKSAQASLPTNEVPEARAFPSRGLTATQIANAIHSVGLEAQILAAQSTHIIKSSLYAYLRGNIPVLMSIELRDITYGADGQLVSNVLKGHHAVSVLGYSLPRDSEAKIFKKQFTLRASRIDKIYVHDDQLGPFARMGFCGSELDADPAKCLMSTVWPEKEIEPPCSDMDSSDEEHQADVQTIKVEAVPQLMVLPLYKKIRIPFQYIHDAVMALNDLYNEVRLGFGKFPDLHQLEWDIYMVTVADFKKEIMATQEYADDTTKALLTPLPKYMWRAKASSNDIPCCDFLFDATGIEQSPLLLFGKLHSESMKALLWAMANAIAQPGVIPLGTNNYQVHSILACVRKLGSSSNLLSPSSL